MSDKARLLVLKAKIKSKKPDFIRQDAHKKAEIGQKWRRPKGLHSKMRLHKKGYRRCISPGWGSPAAVKGLHKSGLNMKIVSSLKDLQILKKENDGVVISSTVGTKKRLELLKKIKELQLKVLNIRDIDSFIKNIEEKIKQKSEKKKERAKKKKEKTAKEKKEREKSKLDEKVTEEEKKEEEKKEKDRLLTKRELK